MLALPDGLHVELSPASVLDDQDPFSFPRGPAPTAPLSLDLKLSSPMELGMDIVKGNCLSFPWSIMNMPDEPGVYRFDCLTHIHDPQIPPDDRWEVEWQYVGEGTKCWARLGQYEDASKNVPPSNNPPKSFSHEMKLASRLMWALHEDEYPDEVAALERQRRVLLSWVTSAAFRIDGRPVVLEMKELLERRFVERALMMLSPWSANEA